MAAAPTDAAAGRSVGVAALAKATSGSSVNCAVPPLIMPLAGFSGSRVPSTASSSSPSASRRGHTQRLHHAVASGNTDQVVKILQADPAAVHTTDGFGRTPLQSAVHLPVCAALMRAGAVDAQVGSEQLAPPGGSSSHRARDTQLKANHRDGMSIAAWHRHRGRPELAALLEVPTCPAAVRAHLEGGHDVAATQQIESALRLARRWLGGGGGDTPLVGELLQLQRRAEVLRAAREEMQRCFRAEQYTHALSACRHALVSARRFHSYAARQVWTARFTYVTPILVKKLRLESPRGRSWRRARASSGRS